MKNVAMYRHFHWLLAWIVVMITGCATQMQPDGNTGVPTVAFQSLGLHPGNGGQLVPLESLQPGDIILSSADAVPSLGIRLLTLSPVSHASLYMGDQHVVEAVGAGIRRRSLGDLLAEESTVVAFRHPGLRAGHTVLMQQFVQAQLGKKYNYAGVVLQAPFALERRVCELPLVPAQVRDFCIRGIAAIQLGVVHNDRFFCSQFVLEAYRSAGLPLTDADPRLISPADLLHMREDDVPSVRIHQALTYVGHLKTPPEAVALAR